MHPENAENIRLKHLNCSAPSDSLAFCAHTVSIELRNAGNLALDFVARAAELYQLPSLRRNTTSLVMGRGSGSEAGEDGKVRVRMCM